MRLARRSCATWRAGRRRWTWQTLRCRLRQRTTRWVGGVCGGDGGEVWWVWWVGWWGGGACPPHSHPLARPARSPARAHTRPLPLPPCVHACSLPLGCGPASGIIPQAPAAHGGWVVTMCTLRAPALRVFVSPPRVPASAQRLFNPPPLPFCAPPSPPTTSSTPLLWRKHTHTQPLAHTHAFNFSRSTPLPLYPPPPQTPTPGPPQSAWPPFPPLPPSLFVTFSFLPSPHSHTRARGAKGARMRACLREGHPSCLLPRRCCTYCCCSCCY